MLHELRAKLKEITLGASGKASQYDEENRKDTAGFVADLTQLAALGSLLWGAVVPSRDDRLQLREQLGPHDDSGRAGHKGGVPVGACL